MNTPSTALATLKAEIARLLSEGLSKMEIVSLHPDVDFRILKALLS